MSQELGAKSLISPALVDALLPGAEFFGASSDNCLTVEVNAIVDRVEISIEAPAAEILNIGEISFVGADGAFVSKVETCTRVEMSSIYGDVTLDKCFSDFIAGCLLHTKAEARPSIQIFFKNPAFVSRVLVKNRGDVYGCRSKYLAIRTFSGHGLVSEYKNVKPDDASRDVVRLLAELSLIDELPGSEKELIPFVREVRRRIIERIESDAIDLSFRQVCQLLPLMETNRELTNYHLALCAFAVLRQWKDNDHVETDFLRSFSPILRTDLSIDKLRAEIERLLSRRTGVDTPVVIGRHRINESKLIRGRDVILKKMQEIIHALSDAGVTAMLGYGTLLGAVRGGSFLPHDDDVDLLVFSDSCNEASDVVCKSKVIEALANVGVGAVESGFGHLHVGFGEPIDLFPVWRDDDKAYLAMENLRVRSVPIGQLFPPSIVDLYGYKFPAPAKPQDFLADRYGEGWRHSDPYYEWPWQIERILTLMPQPVLAAVERRSMLPRRHWGRLCRVAWAQEVKRGDSSPPINSMPSVAVAREIGYDAVVLDVRLSADGVPVLARDDRLFGPDGDIVVSKSPLELIKKFRLGVFDGEDVFIPTLEAALSYAEGMDVQIDARIRSSDVASLRASIDRARYDPARLQFCVYDISQAHALLVSFPESVLVWKTYRPFSEVDEYFLDEAKALGLDGVMLSSPAAGDDIAAFMTHLRERDLRVNFLIHSAADAALDLIARDGVDYITTSL